MHTCGPEVPLKKLFLFGSGLSCVETVRFE
jgi:hypothetical protein